MICRNCNCDVPAGMYCICCGWHQRKDPATSTLEAIYRLWRSRKHYRSLTAKGKAQYDSAWHYLAPIKDRLVPDITLEEYQAIVDAMTARGLSISTEEKVQQLVSQLCKVAITEGLITANFGPELYLDGKERRESIPFDDRHIRLLLQYAAKRDSLYRQAAMITLCLIFTGYRPEELFAVRRKDVNPKEGFLIAGSKTAAGKNRVVPVLPVIAPFITEWYLSCPIDPDAYLIRGPKGGHKDLHNWRQREFYPMTRELGINRPDQLSAKKQMPHITPYSARHTFAMLAWRASVDEKALIKMMGHSNIQVTTRFYLHDEFGIMRSEAQKTNDLWAAVEASTAS